VSEEQLGLSRRSLVTLLGSAHKLACLSCWTTFRKNLGRLALFLNVFLENFRIALI